MRLPFPHCYSCLLCCRIIDYKHVGLFLGCLFFSIDLCLFLCQCHTVLINISSVQSLSHIRLFATRWIAARQASLSITNSWSSLKLKSIESVMPSSHLILCCPLLLPPSIFPSIQLFSSESVLHIRWSKYCSFSFSISPYNEYSWLISFRIDWLDLLAVQESSPTPQFKSINSSALSFLHSPTLQSIHDHWKNCSFDYTDLSRQRCLCFLICHLGLS